MAFLKKMQLKNWVAKFNYICISLNWYIRLFIVSFTSSQLHLIIVLCGLLLRFCAIPSVTVDSIFSKKL